MGLGKRSLIVSGETVDLDHSDLEINDIDETQRKTSSMIAYWASVYGSAEGERVSVDAFYRQWRAKAAEAILKADPKLSEWKVRNKIEASDDFLKIKTLLAKAIDNAITAKGVFEGWNKRSNLSQSVGASKRETMKKTGVDYTRDSSMGDEFQNNVIEDKAEKLRRIRSKRKGHN